MKDSDSLLLFTDGSVNTKLKFGYGAYLAVNDTGMTDAELRRQMKIKRFEDTSSTKLEIQTLLWALTELKDFGGKIILFSDSQNIIGLPGRRERLEKNNYFSKQNKRIGNWELYLAFYQVVDCMNIELIKIKGHKRTNTKDDIDRLFTLVDRASRNALREGNE